MKKKFSNSRYAEKYAITPPDATTHQLPPGSPFHVIPPSQLMSLRFA
jgi:hypothetical protein